MGAEVLMWVEVERPVKEWRKSYGVTTYDALENVKLNIGERLTGVVKTTLDDEQTSYWGGEGCTDGG